MKLKRLLAMLLTVVMVFSLFPTFAFAEEPAGNAGTTLQSSCKVTVSFILPDSSNASNDYITQDFAGTNVNRTIPASRIPKVVGYEIDPSATVEDGAVVVFNDDGTITYTVENLSSDIYIEIHYAAADVNYTVKHYVQNVDDDEFVLAKEDTLTGKTGAQTAAVKDAELADGCTATEPVQSEIAADGSTVVEIYYIRNYYLVTFDPDGGMDGPSPVYGRFGAEIGEVETPVKVGYDFKGWEPALTTIPAENTTVKAKWELKSENAKVTVVVWGENADDEKYSYIDSYSTTAKIGDSFTATISDINNNIADLNICELEAHTHDSTCINPNHVHTLACFGNPNKSTPNNADNFKQLSGGIENGYVYRRGNNSYFVYFDGTWYGVNGNTYAGTLIDSKRISNVYYYKYEPKNLKCSANADYYICGKVEHDHASDNDLYELKIAENVTVAADGSTVVNVYLDRKEFTLTMIYGSNTSETITAKWGQNIVEEWNAVTANAGNSMWSRSNGGGQPWTSLLQVMPAEDRTYYMRNNNGNEQTATYYVENVDDATKYDVYATSTTKSSQYLTVTDEDRFAIDGFTYDHGTANGSYWAGATFYYSRNSYDLILNNGKENVQTYSVKYEKVLGKVDGVKTYEPAKPDTVGNGYEFEGWYLNPDCSGEKVKLDEMTMPSANLVLYANWAPVVHHVTITMDGEPYGGDISAQDVLHNELAANPTTPTSDKYEFLGWFYRDENGVEKAFDFASMPVTRDMDVYGKWNKNVLLTVTAYFKDKETEAEIADPAHEYKFDGFSKTFTAKTDDAFKADYKDKGYFPTLKSTTVTASADDLTQNECTFWYVKAENVPYTIVYNYLNEDDTLEKTESEIVTTNYAAVVAVAPVKSGYVIVGDSKASLTLVVNEDGTADPTDNVITFTYKKDTVNAAVVVNHITVIGGVDEIRANTANTEKIGSTITVNAMTNYDELYKCDFDHVDVIIDGVKETYTADEWNPEFTVPAAGAEINFYYVAQYFTVIYSSDMAENKYELADRNVNIAHFDTTKDVHSGMLYAGLYTDNAFTTPKSDVCGADLQPAAGDVYYVKEISNKYAMPQMIYTYKSSYFGYVLSGLYMVTSIDNANYAEIGFIVDGKGTDESVIYSQINVNHKDGSSNTYTSSKVFGVDGYMHILPAESYAPDTTFVYQPYYITLDGVKVTGNRSVTVKTQDGVAPQAISGNANGLKLTGKSGLYTAAKNISGIPDSSLTANNNSNSGSASARSMLTARSVYSVAWEPEEVVVDVNEVSTVTKLVKSTGTVKTLQTVITLDSDKAENVGITYTYKNKTYTAAAELVSVEDGKAVYSVEWTLSGFTGMNSVKVTSTWTLTDGTVENGTSKTSTYASLAGSAAISKIKSKLSF